MKSDAFISADGLYRYWLTRNWDGAKPLAVYIMLNPSTADASVNDRTINRCIYFAKKAGCGGFVVLNLFNLRSPKPAVLKQAGRDKAIGDPAVAKWLLLNIANLNASHVVLGWGTDGCLFNRDMEVLDVLELIGVKPMCLKVSKDGYPWHPLYVHGDTDLIPYVRPSHRGGGTLPPPKQSESDSRSPESSSPSSPAPA